MNFQRFTLILSFLVAVALPVGASRAQSQDFGDYVVHYNAITTDMLPPSVASAYNIQRSANIALLNITVLKEVLGTAGTPVEAEVEASAVNLTNQHHAIDLRQITEANAIYYIGTLGVDHRETYDFTILVQPEGVKQPFVVKFRQQFFTE